MDLKKQWLNRATKRYTIRTRGFILMVSGSVASVYVSQLTMPILYRVSVIEAVNYILKRGI